MNHRFRFVIAAGALVAAGACRSQVAILGAAGGTNSGDGASGTTGTTSSGGAAGGTTGTTGGAAGGTTGTTSGGGGAATTSGSGGSAGATGGGGSTTTPMGCAPPLTTCGTDCVDTATASQDCGGCGHACEAGCSGGACEATLLACDSPGAWSIAVDEERVYWTNYNEHAVRSVAKAGGTPVTISADEPAALAIGLDATHVYWSRHPNEILRAPKQGGAAETVATSVYGACGIVFDETSLYVGEFAYLGRVLRIPKSGGPATELAPGTCQGVRAIRLLGGSVYWLNHCGEVARVSVDGGPVTILGQGFTGNDLQVDASYAYVSTTTASSSSVMRVPLNGGPAETLVSGIEPVWPLAIDATRVFAVAGVSSDLLQIPLGGGAATVLATAPGGAGSQGGLTQDADYLYWTESVLPGSGLETCVFRTKK
jgi:hypothetical protein